MERWLALALTVLLASRGLAHHAEAPFDHRQTLPVPGTVTEYLWANPHVMIYREGADARGRIDVTVSEGLPLS